MPVFKDISDEKKDILIKYTQVKKYRPNTIIIT